MSSKSKELREYLRTRAQLEEVSRQVHDHDLPSRAQGLVSHCVDQLLEAHGRLSDDEKRAYPLPPSGKVKKIEEKKGSEVNLTVEPTIHRAEDCVVCLDKKSVRVIVPCNHCCLCLECSELLVAQSFSCPICRGAIRKIVPLNNLESTSKIPEAELKSYLERRDEFVQAINLSIDRQGDDLIVSSYGRLAKIKQSKIEEVFKYYLGRTDYHHNCYHSMVEMCGMKIEIGPGGQMVVKENCTKYTFPDFFHYVDQSIVPPNKLAKHIVDHLFQDYLTTTIANE